MDASILPGDNFFLYANGGWMKATEIPPDQAAWGVDAVLAEEAARHTSELLDAASTAPAGTDARKAGDYYASYMDEGGIEAQGLAPLEPTLARIASVKDKQALARLLGEQLRADVDPLNATNFHTDRLFGLWVSPDLNGSGHYVPYLLQGGLGLPGRSYYLDGSRAHGGRPAEVPGLHRLAVEVGSHSGRRREGGEDSRAGDEDGARPRQHRGLGGRAEGQQPLDARSVCVSGTRTGLDGLLSGRRTRQSHQS